MILEYNSREGAVDNADELIDEQSVVSGTRGWPFYQYIRIIDTCELNACTIYKMKNPPNKVTTFYRRNFLVSLGKNLTLPEIIHRYDTDDYTEYFGHVRRAISASIPRDHQKETGTSSIDHLKKRGQCVYYPREQDKKSEIKCQICGAFVSNVHRIGIRVMECEHHKHKDDVNIRYKYVEK